MLAGTLAAGGATFAEEDSAQAEKLNFLITSLVKLSRLETGILTLSPRKTSVFPMLENLIKQI